MFSFMKIATIAALAFGTFTSAMPTVVESRAVESRQTQTLTSILQALPGTLQPDINQLNGLTAKTATPAKVKEIVLSIQVKINLAVSACKGLPAGSIGLGNILALLSVIVKLVITSCGKVYNLPGLDQGSIISIFALIDVSLSALISVVLNLVLGLLGGVLSVVIGLLVSLLGGACTSIIVQLKLSACISLLHL